MPQNFVPSPTVRRSNNPNDPFIYLLVNKEWYCYNPGERLGGGAMGDVYLGYRCRTLEPIAVKRVKDCFANNIVMREKARQEASLAYRHPNLVEMIGVCEYAYNSGPCFLLSKYVKGENIDTYLTRIPDTGAKFEKVGFAICQVLDALDYLHSNGVVHRDVKPSNIMVENDSNVRLMDLGIARQNGGNKWSQFGFIGTPQYSAPEQILRKEIDTTDKIDATTDLYALGITLYELLAGANPMNCATDADTLTKQMTEKLPPSSVIPRRLMHVIWKATEKEQSKRYQSAKDFQQALKSALETPPSFWDKVSGFIMKNLWMLLCIVLLLVIITCVLIFV